MKENSRCPWAKDPLEILYHDTEWCIPEHDDQKLFEMLILEGMQAGLSWSLILKRREHMQIAFDGFNPDKISAYTHEKIEQLMLDPEIIRNRRKLEAMVSNAKAFLAIQQEFGSFDKYIWSFTHGETIDNKLQSIEDFPASSPLSEKVSKDLKKRGFKFVGPVIIYSYLQAIGIVNDHLLSCPFH
ncbi:hypothetical protein AAG570_014011 [Ranatra chinensis]|uniref:DNA-3-methyladenine glycosylase I n=1 Tax=Ranatra chinensis TaxID=642074 RepID=A0ABD0XUS6_9HEMI